jgi:uncharacterized protein (TIGR04222 family)
MNAQEQLIWQRVQAYKFDKPNVSFPFSSKLIRETGWPRSFALRAVEEYRRFAFLHTVAGHPISPSDVVDQVWHLHILYTKEYWQEFCGQVLEKPLHHLPSTGGSTEVEKFEDWYAKTLASYRHFFGEEPPAEIWPTDNVHPRKIKIDPSKHWIINKRALKRWTEPVAYAGSAVIFAGCAQAAGPFDLDGPTFLKLYIPVAGASLIAALIHRYNTLRRTSENLRNTTSQLNEYEVAYLRGGARLVQNTLFAKLIIRRAVRFDPGSLILTLENSGYQPEHSLEAKIMDEMIREHSLPIALARSRTLAQITLIEEQLAEKQLILGQEEVKRAKWIPFTILTIPVLVGTLKISFGLQRERPIEFLVVAAMITFACSLCFLATFRRTFAGRGALESLKWSYRRLQKMGSGIMAHPVDIPMALALYGGDIVSDTEYGPQVTKLQPKDRDYDGSGGGCGSGTWGSDDSGGSSGGSGGDGGGDGGGGCGGCGGD